MNYNKSDIFSLIGIVDSNQSHWQVLRSMSSLPCFSCTHDSYTETLVSHISITYFNMNQIYNRTYGHYQTSYITCITPTGTYELKPGFLMNIQMYYLRMFLYD